MVSCNPTNPSTDYATWYVTEVLECFETRKNLFFFILGRVKCIKAFLGSRFVVDHPHFLHPYIFFFTTTIGSLFGVGKGYSVIGGGAVGTGNSGGDLCCVLGGQAEGAAVEKQILAEIRAALPPGVDHETESREPAGGGGCSRRVPHRRRSLPPSVPRLLSPTLHPSHDRTLGAPDALFEVIQTKERKQETPPPQFSVAFSLLDARGR